MNMLTDIEIPIVIVGFGNADDVVRCLSALGKQRGCPKFGVFLCENAGRDAFNVLAGALSQAGGPCSGAFEQAVVTSPDFLRVIETSLAGRAVPVFVAEAKENFGFAGGVNTWIRLFLREQGWTGVWILNPDTWPEPDALAELVASAEGRHKGMVTSRIMIPGRDDVNSSRGLKWDKLRAKTIGVDIFAPVDPAPDPDDVERRMDAPTGVSLYVSKECIDKIGLMDESYFLYFEEFDWGLLAKAQCGIGYAHNSIVPHVSGSSTGAVRDRKKAFTTRCLSESQKYNSFCSSTLPKMVALDSVSFIPKNWSISVIRFDGQLRRRHQRYCRGFAGGNRPAEARG